MWIPFFLDTKLGIDHIPFEVTAVSYHLGSEPSRGHYCAPVLEGGGWWIFNDGRPPEVRQATTGGAGELLSLVAELHAAWKAEPLSQLAEESPILSDAEKVNCQHHP